MVPPLREPSSTERETTVVEDGGVVVVETLLDGGREVDSTPLPQFLVVHWVIQIEDSRLWTSGLC